MNEKGEMSKFSIIQKKFGGVEAIWFKRAQTSANDLG
jgi:hypothetical protein